ncbi:21_t:CDS:2, partial [Racocetra fulgida]
WWYADDSAEKEDDGGRDENKVSNKDRKPEAPSCEKSLFEWFWENMSQDDSVDKESVNESCSGEYLDNTENKNEKDENKALICHQTADSDEKEILEEDSKQDEGGEPKLEDDHGLVFDKGKIIDRNAASDVHRNELGDNKVKGKGVKMKNDEEVVMNRVKNDYVD